MAHTPEEPSVCDVEVGTHPPPFYKDKNSRLIVCSRHKARYEENADIYGPFDWEDFSPEAVNEPITSVVIDSVWLENLMKQIEDMDFCVVCDNHPSHGHAPACPVKDVREI